MCSTLHINALAGEGRESALLLYHYLFKYCYHLRIVMTLKQKRIVLPIKVIIIHSQICINHRKGVKHSNLVNGKIRRR